MKQTKCLVAVVGLCIAFGAAAQTEKVSRILAQQLQIQEQVESSTGSYSRFDRDARKRIEQAQRRVFALLDGVTDVEQLNAQDRADLFNALEEVKAVITNNDEDRQECWRERKLGSMRQITRCATVAERREAREGGRAWLGDPSLCSPSASGPSCGRVAEPPGAQ